MTTKITDAEAEYRQARELVMDAMARKDVAALEVAVSFYREALVGIRKTLPAPTRALPASPGHTAPTRPVLSTRVDIQESGHACA